MAVTIKMISEVSGVSRGTVDRVLNNRGRVHPETAELVQSVAKKLGYKPNKAGKALAARKKAYVIGVLLTAKGVPFFDEVIAGIKSAQEELAEYGVSIVIETIKGYSPAVQLSALQKLNQKVNAIIFNPINEGSIAEKMQQFWQENIPVVAINTNIENVQKLCYVGSNYYKSGETAAGMMRILLGNKAGTLAILSGSNEIAGHNQRIEGFSNIISSKCENSAIQDIRYTEDDDETAYTQAMECFNAHPGINGIYIAAAGTQGVCKAIVQHFPQGKLPFVVCSDLTPANAQLMQKGIIHAAVCQQPFSQGYEAVRKIFDYLITPGETPDFIVENEIKIPENSYS